MKSFLAVQAAYFTLEAEHRKRTIMKYARNIPYMSQTAFWALQGDQINQETSDLGGHLDSEESLNEVEDGDSSDVDGKMKNITVERTRNG